MSDRIRSTPDAPWREAGTGVQVTFLCLGCNKPRLPGGSRGKDIRRRCAVCWCEGEEAMSGNEFKQQR